METAWYRLRSPLYTVLKVARKLYRQLAIEPILEKDKGVAMKTKKIVEVSEAVVGSAGLRCTDYRMDVGVSTRMREKAREGK